MLDRRVGAAAILLALLSGCSSSAPDVHTSEAPPAAAEVAALPPPRPSDSEGTGFTRIVAGGGGDSVSAVPGSPGAQFRIRFKQSTPPSDRFTFYDRDLSFYFRPTPSALFFQVENKQGKPVAIDWARSTFLTPSGSSQRVANSSSTYDQRFQPMPMTQIAGLQRYSDYLLPLNSLVDPAGSGQQLHRTLLPEDEQAMQFTGRPFGVDLTFLIEGQPRVYVFRFEVVSVIKN